VDRYTRWATLLELLAAQERLSVDEAAERLGVSHATVRRDFDTLARQRKIVRLRGAALHRAAPRAAHLFDGPVPAAPAVARRVAAEAAALVRPGTVVGLCGSVGSPLTGQLARALGVRFDGATRAEADEPAGGRAHAETGPSLTVVTNDLVVASELARRPALKVVATGGVLAAQSLTLTGPLAGLLLQGVSLDMALIGADAVDPAFGVTEADEMAAEGCAQMISRARQVVVLVLSADVDRAAFARVCSVERVDVLVTDTGIAPATVERFASRGVRVVTA
jgi:DeoR family transcriptional regulator, aga operon transcriptional repressor